MDCPSLLFLLFALPSSSLPFLPHLLTSNFPASQSRPLCLLFFFFFSTFYLWRCINCTYCYAWYKGIEKIWKFWNKIGIAFSSLVHLIYCNHKITINITYLILTSVKIFIFTPSNDPVIVTRDDFVVMQFSYMGERKDP